MHMTIPNKQYKHIVWGNISGRKFWQIQPNNTFGEIKLANLNNYNTIQYQKKKFG